MGLLAALFIGLLVALFYGIIGRGIYWGMGLQSPELAAPAIPKWTGIRTTLREYGISGDAGKHRILIYF